MAKLNGHDPDPGQWHPDDLGARWVHASTTQAEQPGAGAGAHVPPRGTDSGRDDAPAGWSGFTEADLIPAPAPIVGYIAAEAPALTVISGRGGRGKGVTASAWAADVIRAGGAVAIVDAEGRRREWARRVSGLLKRVPTVGELVYTPTMPQEWDDHTGLLSLVIVDSLSFVAGSTDELYGPDAAKRLLGWVQDSGVPWVALGHPPKSGEGVSGSDMFRNVARLVYTADEKAGSWTLEVDKANDVPGLVRGKKLQRMVTFAEDGITPISHIITDAEQGSSPEHLLHDYLSEWRTKQEVAEHLGVGLSTAQKMLNASTRVEVSQPEVRGPKYWRMADA